MKGDAYRRWDCSGVYLLAYAMPLKKIWLTGKRTDKVTPVDAATARQLVVDGRGWSHKDAGHARPPRAPASPSSS